MTDSTERRFCWEATGVVVGVVLVLIGFNAWCMKLVIDNAVKESFITVSQTFVTKDEFKGHKH